MELIFTLLVVFQLKHYLADFPFQSRYMLRKNQPGWDFVLPLASHCFIHSLITLAIVLLFRPELWWLFIFDFIIHFIMDRVKSSPRLLGRYNDISKASYWNCFGFDQMVHHVTNYTMIWVIAFH